MRYNNIKAESIAARSYVSKAMLFYILSSYSQKTYKSDLSILTPEFVACRTFLFYKIVNISVDLESKIYNCEFFVNFSYLGNGLSYIGCTIKYRKYTTKGGEKL
jgi:hypothetical protein